MESIEDLFERGRFVEVIDAAESAVLTDEQLALTLLARYPVHGYQAGINFFAKFESTLAVRSARAEIEVEELRGIPSSVEGLDASFVSYISAIHHWAEGEADAAESQLLTALDWADKYLRQRIIKRLLRHFLTQDRLSDGHRLVATEHSREKGWFPYLLSGMLAIAERRPEYALRMTEEARSHPLGLGNCYLDEVEGLAHFMLGSFRRSADLFTSNLNNWPRDHNTWYWLARSFVKLGSLAEADQAARKSLSFNADLRTLRLLAIIQARRCYLRDALRFAKEFMTFKVDDR